MPWGLWSSPPSPASGGTPGGKSPTPSPDATQPSTHGNSTTGSGQSSKSSPSSTVITGIPTAANDATQQPALSPAPTWPEKKPLSWNDSLNATDWQHYYELRNWVPTIVATATALGLVQFYRSYLRRIPGSAHIAPGFFRRRSLLGRVTSVGDGDNFHLFHTPGGHLAGWGWLRRVPKDRKELKGRTIPIRIAGIDAPEGAHFGRPAQPGAAEALTFLQNYLLGRRVRAYVYKRDQYERVVATVYVRRPPFFVPRRDVGLEMLRRGLATTYEAKTGAEFGGPVIEARYRVAMQEAQRRRRGMWAGANRSRAGGAGLFGLGGKDGEEERVETPREFKDRMRQLEKGGKGGEG